MWQRLHHMDVRAREMADDHYSRQTPGAREFTRPGNKIVLGHFDAGGVLRAIWASQRPDPGSGVKRADGLDAWDCSIFRRVDGAALASDLIREAVAVTLAIWGAPPN